MFTLTFNKNTSAQAAIDNDANLLYLRYQENYINDLFKVRGYMYMNTIYELLGVKWNPEWENLCRIYNGDRIIFKVRKVGEDGFELDIE